MFNSLNIVTFYSYINVMCQYSGTIDDRRGIQRVTLVCIYYEFVIENI